MDKFKRTLLYGFLLGLSLIPFGSALADQSSQLSDKTQIAYCCGPRNYDGYHCRYYYYPRYHRYYCRYWCN